MTNIVPVIKETRGLKRIYNFDVAVGAQMAFAADDANRVRAALGQWRNRHHVDWEFRSWIENKVLTIVRIK